MTGVRGYELRLHDALHSETVAGVTSFVGEDASGSFGILAGHARFMTCLTYGLARFRVGDGPWRYLALPGGVLYFADDVLTVSTRRCVMDDDYERISATLTRTLFEEERALRELRVSVHRMEEEVLRRMWEIGREAL